MTDLVKIAIASEFSLLLFSVLVGLFVGSGSSLGEPEDVVAWGIGTFVGGNVLAALGGIAYLVWRWAL